MSFHDPISDLLTRMRNAKMAEHRFVDLVKSKMTISIVKLLKDNGYIENYLVDDKKFKIRVFFKVAGKRQLALQGLKRVSTPGLKRYVGYQDIPRVLSGMGIAILSTSKGVLEGETARRMKVGGELLCVVW